MLFTGGCFSRPEFVPNDDGGTGSDGALTCDFSQAPGLVAYLPFDEVTGTTTPDRSPNAHTGTLHGALALAPGHRGMAMRWTAQNQYVDLGSMSALDQLPAMTMCLWIQPAARSDGLVLLDKSMNGTYGGWNFYLTSNPTTHGLGFVTRSAVFQETPRVIPTDGTWTHVCATWDGMDAQKVGTMLSGVRLYLDADVIAPDYAEDANRTAPASDGPYPLRIGSGYEVGTDYTYRGLIDDVLLFDRVLDESQIEAVRDCTL
jgi:hypothetical protein